MSLIKFISLSHHKSWEMRSLFLTGPCTKEVMGSIKTALRNHGVIQTFHSNLKDWVPSRETMGTILTVLDWTLRPKDLPVSGLHSGRYQTNAKMLDNFPVVVPWCSTDLQRTVWLMIDEQQDPLVEIRLQLGMQHWAWYKSLWVWGLQPGVSYSTVSAWSPTGWAGTFQVTFSSQRPSRSFVWLTLTSQDD